MKILPIPKVINKTNKMLLDKKMKIIENDFTLNLYNLIKSDFDILENAETLVYVKKCDFENTEAYKIIIDERRITIEAASEKAAYYGFITLKQIFEETIVQTQEIFDYPDLKIRGVLLDISRSKVPNVDTLKSLIDLFSKLKMNQLQLYIEGLSFEYDNFKDYLIDKNYIKKADYLTVQEYANNHYIDFVPNQNGFGHMSEWLKIDEFKHLGEVEDKFYMWGCFRNPSTLDPTNPESKEFVLKLYDDMLPLANSKHFNMNFDEPYELGFGKSKKKVEETSVEDVYVEYFNSLAKVVQEKYKKIPMIWADVLINNSDAISKINPDTIFIDWGYHKNYPYESHAKVLNSLKVKYLFAPGTSSWASITGKYTDMITTIKNSTDMAKAYNGLGIIVTDWGDVGHLQYLPFSYLGFIYAGLASWSNSEIDDAIYYLQKFINDTYLTESLLKLSQYSLLEGDYRDYGTRLFSTILWAEHSVNQENPVDFFKEKIKHNLIDNENLEKLDNYFAEIYKTLCLSKSSLIKDEAENSLNLLKTLRSIHKKLLNDCNDFDEEIMQLQNYLTEHKRLWFVRNIIEGYKHSACRINWLIEILIRLSRKEII